MLSTADGDHCISGDYQVGSDELMRLNDSGVAVSSACGLKLEAAGWGSVWGGSLNHGPLPAHPFIRATGAHLVQSWMASNFPTACLETLRANSSAEDQAMIVI